MASKRIVLMEDDPIQAEWIAEQIIWDKFPDAEIKYYDSEYSFMQACEAQELQNWKPEYALFDLLTRYYSPNDLANMAEKPSFDNLPPPDQAGVRCRNHLHQICPETKSKIITVMVGALAEAIQKGSDDLEEQLIAFFWT